MGEMSDARNSTPWDALMDNRFDSTHPGRTLWRLFADQRRKVAGTVALFVVKQSPASLFPLAVGMIVDALNPLREDSFRRILWIAGGYLLLLAQNPLLHTAFARMMSGLLPACGESCCSVKPMAIALPLDLNSNVPATVW
jgi:hypothetical protein